MSIKILTKSGEEITAIDDARAYNFDAGNKSGIVKGALNEGKLFLVSSNVIGLDSCELRISGHRIVIDSAESITMANRPSVATRYSMIAEVVVNDASVPSFRLFIQPSKTELIQQNLYKTLNGNGTYQLRIGNFTLETDGLISDIVRTADVISGATNGVGDIEFNVTTETIAGDLEPEVNVDFNEETKKYDMHFALPLSSGTSVIENGEVVKRFNADSKVDKVEGKGLSTNDFTKQEKNKLEGIEKDANHTTTDSALSTTSENPVQNKVVTAELNKKVNESDLLDKHYPVGSIYMSEKATSPASLFGGTWERLKDRFLLGAGDTYSNGSTGGEASHLITENESPRPVLSFGNQAGTEFKGSLTGSVIWTNGTVEGWVEMNRRTTQTPLSLMPPYLVVYMWKRVG